MQNGMYDGLANNGDGVEEQEKGGWMSTIDIGDTGEEPDVEQRDTKFG